MILFLTGLKWQLKFEYLSARIYTSDDLTKVFLMLPGIALPNISVVKDPGITVNGYYSDCINSIVTKAYQTASLSFRCFKSKEQFVVSCFHSLSQTASGV